MNSADLKAKLKAGSQDLLKENYDKAKESFNDILDDYPECSQAYIGLLMAELKVNSYSSLEKLSIRISDLKNFIRAKEFADAGFKQKLLIIEKRNEENRNKKTAPVASETIESNNIEKTLENNTVKNTLNSEKEDSFNSIVQESKNETVVESDIDTIKVESGDAHPEPELKLQLEPQQKSLQKSKTELQPETKLETPKQEDKNSTEIINKKDVVKDDSVALKADLSDKTVEKNIKPIETPKQKSKFPLILIVLSIFGVLAGAAYWGLSTDTDNDTKKTENVEKNTKVSVENTGVDFSKPMTFRVGKIDFQMMPCPAGSFMMGSPENELGRYSNEKQHKVTITKPFFIGQYEVTQKLYEAVIEENPSQYKNDDLPVESVILQEAQLFCEKLNEMTLATRPDNYIFTIPTEAQWEYACRAGSNAPLYSGQSITSVDKQCSFLDEIAWYYCNAFGSTQPVGGKKPNAWQIYDMLGNVSELCVDSYKEDLDVNEVEDPCINEKGNNYIVEKGGNVFTKPKNCRSATRTERPIESSDIKCGFRIVLVNGSSDKN